MPLAELKAAGLVELLDVELARALCHTAGVDDASVELAIALTSRHIRLGHTCFPMALAASQLWTLGSLPTTSLPDSGPWMEALRMSPLTQNGPLVLDDAGRLYLRRYWQLEQDIAAELAMRTQERENTVERWAGMNESLERLFPADSLPLQREAAFRALRHHISLLCGGPGTGKTTTVASIVALLVEHALDETDAAPRVMLLAPTGKAAARLGEAVRHAKARIRTSDQVLAHIPTEAATLHRALGMQRDGLRFWRDADRPLHADIIVVDEASMIDLALMRQLLIATPSHSKLLIVGDPDQLTSVEAGSVLRDLVEASAKTSWSGSVSYLTQTHRYDETQGLGRLVAAVRAADAPTVDALLDDPHSDEIAWAPLECLSRELDRAAAQWSEVLLTRDPQTHFALRSRYVVLTPFRRGPLGTARLGTSIRERLSRSFGQNVRVTPIIIEENSRELQVFNGDFAMRIDDEGAKAVVQGETAAAPRPMAAARLPRHSEAFALSIHKSQGSEFDEILIVLPGEDGPLLTRELLYTAVSRAKARLRIVGPKEVLHSALSRQARRDSGLVDAIAEAAQGPSRNA